MTQALLDPKRAPIPRVFQSFLTDFSRFIHYGFINFSRSSRVARKDFWCVQLGITKISIFRINCFITLIRILIFIFFINDLFLGFLEICNKNKEESTENIPLKMSDYPNTSPNDSTSPNNSSFLNVERCVPAEYTSSPIVEILAESVLDEVIIFSECFCLNFLIFCIFQNEMENNL